MGRRLSRDKAALAGGFIFGLIRERKKASEGRLECDGSPTRVQLKLLFQQGSVCHHLGVVQRKYFSVGVSIFVVVF